MHGTQLISVRELGGGDRNTLTKEHMHSPWGSLGWGRGGVEGGKKGGDWEII